MTGASFTLRELLAGIADITPAQDCPIAGLAIDSRGVKPGDCFLAFPGVATDGRRFIEDAAARGAAAVLYEANGFAPAPLAIPCVAIASLREKLGAIASRFYGDPSRTLVVVGVTGTNGKTTCTQLLAQALDQSEGRAVVIGTLGYGFPGELDSSLHTTPDAVTVQRLLADFLAHGARYAAMEVSSHALHQGRVNATHFDVAVFTNLTHDHLDYHGDMAAYAEAKARLFEFPGLRHAVINVDDAFGRELAERLAGRVNVLTYGLERGDVGARAVQLTHEGMTLKITSPAGTATLTSPLFGRFNASNLLAVFATLLALGMLPNEAAERLSRARPAAGRMERFGGRSGNPLVVVDYAHTPDALEKVLTALREHTAGQLVCVFGCGGDRDRSKRPLMGAIAERLADRVIVTDDNPRHEDPQAIVGEIRAGMSREPLVVRDRRAAIGRAIAEAGAEDIVLVAGKGHEDYQQVGERRLAYSDRAAVRDILGAAA